MTIYSFDKNTIQHDPLHEMLLRLCDVFSDDDSDGARILFGPEINIPLDGDKLHITIDGHIEKTNNKKRTLFLNNQPVISYRYERNKQRKKQWHAYALLDISHFAQLEQLDTKSISFLLQVLLNTNERKLILNNTENFLTKINKQAIEISTRVPITLQRRHDKDTSSCNLTITIDGIEHLQKLPMLSYDHNNSVMNQALIPYLKNLEIKETFTTYLKKGKLISFMDNDEIKLIKLPCSIYPAYNSKQQIVYYAVFKDKNPIKGTGSEFHKHVIKLKTELNQHEEIIALHSVERTKKSKMQLGAKIYDFMSNYTENIMYEFTQTKKSGEVKAKALILCGKNQLMIMEYCEGNDLYYNYVNNIDFFNTFDKNRQKWLLTAINNLLKSVADFHNKGFIHGDLKIENMIITKDHHMRIIDFLTMRDKTILNPPIPYGTTAYFDLSSISAKIADNDYTIDKASDIFAVGLIILFLLTNHFSNPSFTKDNASKEDYQKLKQNLELYIQEAYNIIATLYTEKFVNDIKPFMDSLLCDKMNRRTAQQALERFDYITSKYEDTNISPPQEKTKKNKVRANKPSTTDNSKESKTSITAQLRHCFLFKTSSKPKPPCSLDDIAPKKPKQ